MVENQYTEISYTWMDEFPFPDKKETYRSLNELLPQKYMFTPVYTDKAERVCLLKLEEE